MSNRDRCGVISTVGSTPLIKLERIFRHLEIELFAKLEQFNPGGSVKDRPALQMIRTGMESGAIKPGTVIVESSSGNMGIGLAQVCRFHKLPFICVVDPKTTKQNLALLRAYGAQIEMVEEADPATGEYLSARLARVRALVARIGNSFWPNQYCSEYNASAHHETMREILDALGRPIDFLFCATSTCGTLKGCSDYLRGQLATTKIVAVDALGSVIFGGSRSKRLIPGHGAAVRPGLFQDDMADACIHISDLDCVRGCHRLVSEEALLCGGSSGAIVSAIEKFSVQMHCGALCVAILPDRGERYLDTIYSKEWVGKHFQTGADAAVFDTRQISPYLVEDRQQTLQVNMPQRRDAATSFEADGLLVIKGSEAAALLDGKEQEIIERVEEAYKLHALSLDRVPQSVFLRFSDDSPNRIIALPAYLAGDYGVAGVKWISSFPDNISRGLERASGVIVLNSTETGFPDTILEASFISAKRTAASAAAAVRLLMEKRSIGRAGVVGCGIINFEVLRFLQVVCPEIRSVVIFDVDEERAHRFRQRCLEELGFGSIEIAWSVTGVLSANPLISFATTAARPYVSDMSQCRSDAIILHLSLRDLTPEVILTAKNIVDDADHACRAQTSLALAAELTGNRSFISATIGDLLLSRSSVDHGHGPSAIQIFSPFGLGTLDLAVGSLVRNLALKAKKGTWVGGFSPSLCVSEPV